MTVFFDIDDTIYARSTPFIEAMKEFFGSGVSDAAALCAYRRFEARGNEVFIASQRGEISMDEMNIYRYCRGLEDAGLTISADDALRLEALYCKAKESICLTPVMEEILAFSTGAFDNAGILTNGPAEKQRSKINTLGLGRFFRPEMIIVSGEVGMDKPEPGIFLLAQQRCGAEPGDILYVGDSPRNDMIPAKALGWKTLFFNRFGIDAAPVPHDREVRTEEEMLAALKDISINGI